MIISLRPAFLLAFLMAGIVTPAGTASQARASEPETGNMPCAAQGCHVAGGRYHIALPNDAAYTASGKLPAVLHLHGLGGAGARVLRNAGFRKAITTRGYALIAPTGRPTTFPDGRKVANWSVRDGQEPLRDELAFLSAIVADVAKRFSIDPKRIVLSGFSRGGSMVWDLACAAPGTFAAYAPVAGAFWRPLPQTCAGPVRLFHTHGWIDTVVPIEGRKIPVKPIHQGDTFAGLDLWRTTNRCAGADPDAFEMTARFWRRRWTHCAPGSALELMLHPGRHTVPNGWARVMLDWFEDGIPGD